MNSDAFAVSVSSADCSVITTATQPEAGIAQPKPHLLVAQNSRT